jgi:membrane protein YdbS with pleckstrin-like domain
LAYPDTVLLRGEHVLAHRRPHWRMLVLPALVVPVTAFLAAFTAGAAGGLAGTPATVARVAILVVALAVVGRFAVVPLLSWRCTHFVVTDRRLLVREGVLARESLDVAGASITAVRTRATARERLVGCGTLVVATVSAPEPWEFAGLGGVDRLAALTEQMAEDRGGLRPAAEDDDDIDADADWGTWASEDADELRDDDDRDDEDEDDGDGRDDGDDDESDAVGVSRPVPGASRFRRRRNAGLTSR